VTASLPRTHRVGQGLRRAFGGHTGKISDFAAVIIRYRVTQRLS
jgi:hypothetical protein